MVLKKVVTLRDKSKVYQMDGEYARIYKSGKIEMFNKAILCNVKGKRGYCLKDVIGLRLVDEGIL